MMRPIRYILIPILVLSAFSLRAQTPEALNLWPDDPAKAGAEVFVYRPADTGLPAPAVVVCPGGAYQGLAIGYEGHDAARWFADQGLVALVLKYRMPEGNDRIPLEDALQALTLVRNNAEAWGVDTARIGIAGFSAGGHLAATVSTLAPEKSRPDFAILFYPVINMTDDAVTHQISRAKLLGKGAHDPALRTRYSLEKQVNGHTPPTLLLLSDDDTGVPPVNSSRYYEALKSHSIPAAMYIFPSGEHGWGFKPDFVYHSRMKELVRRWLRETGITE